MRVNSGDDVEQAGDDDEFSAVVGYRGLDRLRTEAQHTADEEKQAVAQVAGHAQHIENVLCAGVELALHGEAEHEHGDDGDSEQGAADPFTEQKMPSAGDEPSDDEGKIDKSLL